MINLFIRGRITFKTMAFIVDQKVVDVLNKSFLCFDLLFTWSFEVY